MCWCSKWNKFTESQNSRQNGSQNTRSGFCLHRLRDGSVKKIICPKNINPYNK